MLVKNMVRRYIENPCKVIFAGLAANVNIANTKILDMAAEVDPSGQRTLGILTKPNPLSWNYSVSSDMKEARG